MGSSVRRPAHCRVNLWLRIHVAGRRRAEPLVEALLGVFEPVWEMPL